MSGRGQVNGKRLNGRPLCPADPTHGYLESWTGKYQWYCPHQEHDGPPGGPPTKSFFTDEEIKEAENGQTGANNDPDSAGSHH